MKEVKTDDKVTAMLGCGVVLLVCLFCSGCGVMKYHGIYDGFSEGERKGEVYKFSRKGLIWKSWEGEMKLSDFGLRPSGRESFTNVFVFSVTDEEVAKQIESAIGRNEKVVLHYRQWWMAPASQDSDYTITQVEASKE